MTSNNHPINSLQTSLLLLLLISPLAGLTDEAQPPKPGSPATSSAAAPDDQVTPPARPEPERASTFTPTEKISADSSVSFPVDI